MPPSAAHHRRVAARNLRLSIHLDAHPEWSDWAETSIFYAAHHEVMALFRERDIVMPEKKHGQMTRLLRDEGWPEMAKIHGALLGRSYRARYHGGNSTRAALDDSRQQLATLKELIYALPPPTP